MHSSLGARGPLCPLSGLGGESSGPWAGGGLGEVALALWTGVGTILTPTLWTWTLSPGKRSGHCVRTTMPLPEGVRPSPAPCVPREPSHACTYTYTM